MKHLTNPRKNTTNPDYTHLFGMDQIVGRRMTMLKPVAFIAGMLLASTAHAQSSFTPNQFYGGMMQHQQETLRSYQEQERPSYSPPTYHNDYDASPRMYQHERSTPCGGYTGIAC